MTITYVRKKRKWPYSPLLPPAVTIFTNDILLKINSLNLTIKHKWHGLEIRIKRYTIRSTYLAVGFSVVPFGKKAPYLDSRKLRIRIHHTLTNMTTTNFSWYTLHLTTDTRRRSTRRSAKHGHTLKVTISHTNTCITPPHNSAVHPNNYAVILSS